LAHLRSGSSLNCQAD